MMLIRFVPALVCAASALACGPTYHDTATPDDAFTTPRKGALTMHAPEKTEEVRVRRLRPGLRADVATLGGQIYNVPPAIVAAFGPQEPMRVDSKGLSLGPVSAAELDAVWLEGAGLSSPRIAPWKPLDGQLLRLSNGEVSGNPLPVFQVNASTAQEAACAEQPPSHRFGWSDTLVVGAGLRLDKLAAGAEPACRSFELAKEGASAKMELCPGPPSVREGDVVRVEIRDLEQASYHQRARILMMETPRETIWMVRGYTNDLASVLAPMGIHSLSWSLSSACSLSPADGCGVGGMPAQVQVAFKPGDRSFALRAGETVRGNFGGADIELQIVRASFRPFRNAECAHDAADFGMVLTRAGTLSPKATIAR